MSYTLGLDLGNTSIGWVLLKTNDAEITGIEAMGVRIFPDGREAQSKEPLAVARRMARSMRRSLDRRLLRQEKLMRFLIENGLYPANEADRKKLVQLNPYACRDKASREEVNPFEVGRALYHICLRRGFLSNRKTDKKDKESGSMKTAIHVLEEKIAQSGAQTLGQYLYLLQLQDDHAQLRVSAQTAGTKNVYNFYPSRAMYEQEVDQILMHQSYLSAAQKNEIKGIIFYQRPLKKPQVGFCTLEEKERRAPKSSILFQYFRLLQKLNDLEYVSLDTGECLTDENRQVIKEMLLKSKEVSFETIRKKLGVSYRFSHEDEKTSKLTGHEINAKMSSKKAFGSAWFELSGREQEHLVMLLSNLEKEDVLEKYLKQTYPDLSDEQVEYLLGLSFPEGYGHLSRRAMLKIIPFMEKGLSYYDACEAAGYHETEQPHGELLPYYGEILYKKLLGGSFNPSDQNTPELYYGKINNPTVHIGLNQLRLLVNELIAQYEKPTQIVVELARELKMSQKDLNELNRRQAADRKENEKINFFLKEQGLPESYENRMRYKLWTDLAENPLERCCPFCGRTIGEGDIFSPAFETEHLLPFSRSFNDGRNNKVLACKECNNFKKNQTPWEAFHTHVGDKYDWENILARVSKMNNRKAWHFTKEAAESLDENTVLNRFLNDTKYLSKMAKAYLEYICPVRTIPGQLTSKMRKIWQFNDLIGETDEKDRTEHRHHAIDALTVACTTRSTLQAFSTHSKESYERQHKILAGSLVPFKAFNRAEMKQLLENMVISYKPNHKDAQKAVSQGKTAGALHDETNYGKVMHLNDDGSVESRYVVRKPLISLIEDKNIEEIGDRKIRHELQTLLAGKSKEERKKLLEAYSEEKNIRTVRVHIIKKDDAMIGICRKGQEKPYRYVASGNNYCMDIYCPNRGKNKGVWCGEVISNYEAHQKGFQPQWRQKEPEAKLIMRLFIDDMVAYEENGQTEIRRVKKMDKSVKVYLRSHLIAAEEADKLSWAASPRQLQLKNARKIKVDVLGRVFDPKSSK